MEDNNFTPPPVPPVDGRGGWQASPVRDSSNDIPPMKPNNWLWQSIVATILCCIVFGIVGIVYAAKVDSLYYKGQYYEAERAAKKAKMWTLIAVVVGLVYIAVTVSWYLTGNFPEQLQEIIENSASGYNF
ncbi:MAG: CD225/dispanin family protein [Bacteroidota bacterium]|jgi:H+/Cl- antiporter ClcA|nr:CD225/dispanin family protein [Bacteroidota bacterium]